eukprot:6976837-Lingulodinium_polyedra.AAC.1
MGWESFATRGTRLATLKPGHEEPVQLCLDGPWRSCWVCADQMGTGPTGVSFLQSSQRELGLDL